MKFEQIRRSPVSNKNGIFVIACPQMKNNNNVSMIARTASCLGATGMIVTGWNKIDSQISRDISISISYHRSLLPVIQKYRSNGYCIIGLEQTNKSVNLYNYKFPKVPILLVIGNECKGMDQDILNELDEAIEIPHFNSPHSLNVAVAASVCLFEYAKQCNGDEICLVSYGSLQS